MKPNPLIKTAILAGLSLAPALHAANDVTGSIGFGSLGASIPGTDLSAATSFTLSDAFITTETGAYTGAPIMTSITFDGFQFFPPGAFISQQLWAFNVGPINYSFDATSITSSYNPTLNEWDIGGNGMANVTGFNPTPAIWNVNLSQSGGSVVFDSSAAPMAVPEDSTLVLTGAGLVVLASFIRRPNT